ncbi:MAG: signal peptidase II [Acutalibacteraceae bacterium]
MKIRITDLRKHKIIALVMAILAIAADQATKLLAAARVPHDPKCIVAIPHILDFRYLENRGAAFGMLKDHRWVFLIATTVFLIVAIYAFFSKKIKSALVNYALMLIISGGIGNMIDRVFRGYVIDFINFSFMNFFVFNIADCCVVIGCALFILYLVLDTVRGRRSVADHE